MRTTQAARLGNAAVATDNVERHPGQAVEPDGAGASGSHVDDPAGDERPPVIDADDHRTSVACIGDLDLGAEGQGPVRRREARGVGELAVRGFLAAVYGGYSALAAGHGGEGEQYSRDEK